MLMLEFNMNGARSSGVSSRWLLQCAKGEKQVWCTINETKGITSIQGGKIAKDSSASSVATLDKMVVDNV